MPRYSYPALGRIVLILKKEASDDRPRQSRPCHSRLLQIRFVYRLRPLKGLRAPYQHSLCLWRASSPIVGHAPPFVSRAHNPITVPGPLRPGAPIVSFLLASQVLIYTTEQFFSIISCRAHLITGREIKHVSLFCALRSTQKKINLVYNKIKIVSFRSNQISLYSNRKKIQY